MKKQSSISLFILLVFAVPFTAYALLNLYQKKAGQLPVFGESKNHRISNFHLTNQEGKQISVAEWDNKIVVADFFFTHCPTICPKMTMSLKKIQEQYNAGTEIFLQSFTVDPERDSAVQLEKYCNQYKIDNSNWSLATGDKKEIYKLARNSFMIVATDGDGGPNDFIHSEKLVLVDKQKRIRGYYDGTSDKEVNQLINDIKKLQNEN
jgi:protein SCO1/2